MDDLAGAQKALLPFVVAGATNKEIAKALGLRFLVVQKTMQGMFNHLGFKNRTQLAVWAHMNGVREYARKQNNATPQNDRR